MKLLLDTHVWLWLQTTPERIRPDTLARLGNSDNVLLLSAASAWEIAIKFALGKLPLPMPPAQYVPQRMEQSGTTGLSVQPVHALRVASLPDHHRDPFDRLLVAQAQIEGITLVTLDEQITRYEVPTLPA